MILRLGIVAAALALAFAPLPPDWIERFYSNGIYPPAQRLVTALSNQAPVALFDVLLIGVVGWWVAAAAFDLLRRPSRKAGRRSGLMRVVVRTVTLAAGLYLAFLLMWGLNYRRVPLERVLRYDDRAVSPDAAVALAERTVAELNRHHAAAHARAPVPSAVDPALARAFERARAAVGAAAAIRPARPKRTIVDPYFRAAGVEGMTDPFFLETLVVSNLLFFERPAVIAHEWAHLAGIGDEGAANFMGWLTCMYGDSDAQYSGWLMLYGEVVSRVAPAERTRIAGALAPGPRDDLRAMAERSRQNVQPAVANAGWRVYDGYLKANRVEQGTASYAEVVRLVLGTAVGRQAASGVAGASGTSRESPL